MKWFRNDSTEQVDQINDSDKQVDAIGDSEELDVTGSNPKSDPSSDTKVYTHTTNRNFIQNLLRRWFVPKTIPVLNRKIKPRTRNIEPAPDSAIEGEQHGRGGQSHVYFPGDF